METESGEEQPYDVFEFGDNGFKEIYASYSK